MSKNDRDAVAPAWNDFPEGEYDRPLLYGPDDPIYRVDAETTKPVTDHESKTVMLQAQRGDNITIKEVVDRYDEVDIPDFLTVIERSAVYFGPELKLHAKRDGVDFNYLLTSPGPDAHLILWASNVEVDDDGSRWRRGWYQAAEVTAKVHGVRQYEFCNVCGEPMETIQHERESVLGMCQRGGDTEE